MTTSSWPKWSYWDSPWPGIWPWLLSKRELLTHEWWLEEKALLHFCIVYKIQVIKMCYLIKKTCFIVCCKNKLTHPLKVFICSCSELLAHLTVCTDITLHVTCSHTTIGTLHTMYSKHASCASIWRSEDYQRKDRREDRLDWFMSLDSQLNSCDLPGDTFSFRVIYFFTVHTF